MTPQEQGILQELCKRQRWDDVWEKAKVASLDWYANLALFLQRQNASLSQAAAWRRSVRVLEAFPMSRGATLRIEGEKTPVQGGNQSLEAGPNGVEVVPEPTDFPIGAMQKAWVNQAGNWRRMVGSEQVVLGETIQGTWVFSAEHSQLWRGLKPARNAFAGDHPVLRCTSGAVVLDAQGKGVITLYAGPNSSVRVLGDDIYVVGFESLGGDRVQHSFVKAGPPRTLGELDEHDLQVLQRASGMAEPLSDLFSVITQIRGS